MVIGTPARLPEKLALIFRDRQVVDIGRAHLHQAAVGELPVFATLRAPVPSGSPFLPRRAGQEGGVQSVSLPAPLCLDFQRFRVKIADDPAEQSAESSHFLLGEALQGGGAAFQKHFLGLRKLPKSERGEGNKAAALVFGVWSAPNKAVALHTGQQMRHSRLLDAGQMRQLLLGQSAAVFEGEQHRHLGHRQTVRREPLVAPAGQQAGRSVNQVAGPTKCFTVHEKYFDTISWEYHPVDHLHSILCK